ncbi:DUF4089 domain-containing protein [Roseofilum reptotaenium CS-1145]|uniref:DUF4089 domain-containing protein n=1 Tax=Roseofilum reptotaenium AO1-A TaxID=1925591 RepID=A0A1L9QXT5_9CYAN|nr:MULTISPECIES: DUF4089 domain-containing protein [Roseofilum]OJJ27449.1 DUF4089 domain-containing protein [Roseofilum reptotaenium AO1-A]MBP0013346.1 DUF4089 domain-containing protein [Roseofilum sp. SID3]MBP0022479.1 DUF4089 domain-containing protein [Roseofilum sp. SID2]MBP0028499.1 DUF4089 domain-containing protein [Roseofilum sp. Guam]MBP0037702.1 DUF4089 domain-containing protein [Roseofilum sp. SID1]
MNTQDPDPETFVVQMASMLDLPPEWANQPGTIDNITRLMAIAQSLNQFPLPEDLEVAPIFKP